MISILFCMKYHAERRMKEEVKDLKDWAAVQKVYKRTRSKRETARVLGISRNTVKKLLDLSEEPVYCRSIYPSKLDDFKEQIIEWRCEPYCFNGTRIFRELKKKGYDGSIGPVYRLLRKIDEDTDGNISSKATVRHESPPGDQAQFDWSEYDVTISGIERKVFCFAMILAASRKKAVCFSLKEDADAIYEAVQELFEDLGGVTLEMLIDNPKAFVIENNPKSEEEIRYNPHALLLAKHLGTELNACPCYWPRKKGKIERPFSYIEEQFIKGNTFGSMEELNRKGKEFINEWCDEVHTTTKRIPNQHYLQEEQECLQKLPSKRFHLKKMMDRKVSPDSYISVEGSKYSVPVKYVDKIVHVRMVYGFRIMVYDRHDVFITSIEKSLLKNDVITNEEHYEAIAKKVPTSIPQIRRDFTSLFTNGKEYLEKAGKRFDQPTHYARKIMELQELYDIRTLDCLISVAIEKNLLSVREFRGLLREYNSGKLTLPDSGCDGEWNRQLQKQQKDDTELIRDCSYYESIGKELSYVQ